MKSLVLRLCILVICLSYTLTAGVKAQGETRLKAGEQIQITLTGAPPTDMSSMASQPYGISNTGTISLQYLKAEVRAAGLTPSELARQISASYKSAGIYTNPTINVARVLTAQTQETVTVSGEVKVPGTVVWRPGLTVIDAISEKGGFGDFGNPGKVKLIRKGQSPRELDLRNVSRTPENNITLQATDLIVVPKAGVFGR